MSTFAVRRRPRVVWLVLPLVAISVLGTVADWAAPALLLAHPLVVVALDPKIRYLALTAGRVALPIWLAAGFLRLFATDPLWYLLGRWHGQDAAAWLDRRLGMGQALRLIERWFARASWPIVIVAPSGVVCLLAGAAGMSWGIFLVLDVVGTAGRLALVRFLAGAFPAQVGEMSHFVGRYAWWLIGISLVFAGGRLWRLSRRCKASREHGTEVLSIAPRRLVRRPSDIS